MSKSYPETVPLSSLIGNDVHNSDGEVVGAANDILINKNGSATAVLLHTGGILGIGMKTVVVPFSECAIVERDENAYIVLLHLHSGEVLVAPEYRVPGGTPLQRITNQASVLGQAAIMKAGAFGAQAADKTAVFGKMTVDRATDLARKGANQVTKFVHKDNNR